MAEKTGDIKLNGVSYRVQLDSYRGRDASDFAPRASTPGGGIVFSEMALYQPLNQTDWRHGFGFHWHTDASGYSDTVGNIDTRQPGIAMLHTDLSSRMSTLRAFGGGFSQTHLRTAYILAWYPVGGVHKYTIASQTWSTISSLSAVQGLCGWTNGKYTFISGTGRLKKSIAADLETWTDAGANANASNYIWIVPHDGYVYAGKGGTNYVYFDNHDDLSYLYGDPADDPAAIVVGTPGRVVIGAISYAGDLYFARYDGLFKMDKDRTTARRVLDYSDQESSYNFNTMAVFNGSLYFPIRNQIFQWNGTRVSPVTPPRLNDVYPYTTYSRYSNFVVIGSHLFMTAKTSDSTYTDLIAFDGVGWFRLNRITSDSTHGVGAMDFITTETEDSLWLDITSASSGLYRIPFQSYSDLPYASYPTSGQHSLISSRYDAGFRRIQKSTPSVVIMASGLSAGHYYLKLYYRKNNETSWTAWGNADGTTNLISTTGVTELKDPTGPGTGFSTIEYYWIQFRVDFVSDNAAYTPVLEDITVRLIMRPDTNYGYSFNVIAGEENEYANARTDDRDPYGILTDLRALRDSKSPVTFETPFGVTKYVYVTSVNELAVEEHVQDMGAYPNIEQVIQLNLIEVD